MPRTLLGLAVLVFINWSFSEALMSYSEALMSNMWKKLIVGLLMFAALTGCSSGAEEEAVVLPTTSPSESPTATINAEEIPEKPMPTESPTESKSSNEKPQTDPSNSAKPISTTKAISPSQGAQPKKTQKSSTASTSQNLPERFEIGKPYPWENDFNPLRFGLAYTNLKPVEWTNYYAVYLPAPDQVLLVRAYGDVRAGFLYKGVTGYKTEKANKNTFFQTEFIFRAYCGDEESGTGHALGWTWTKTEHPSTFTNLPLEEESPCTD